MADEKFPPTETNRAAKYEIASQLVRDTKAAWEAAGKPKGPLLTAFHSACIKKAHAAPRGPDSKRKSVNELRLVKAVAAERSSERAIHEAAAMVEDTSRVLRLAVNEYGRIARKELAEFLLKRLQEGTEEHKDDAARRLQDLFERIVDTQSDISSRNSKRKSTPGWPSEGAKS